MKGLTGAEVFHDETSDEDIQRLEDLCIEEGISIGGGSDFHGNAKDTTIGNFGNGRCIPYVLLGSQRYEK